MLIGDNMWFRIIKQGKILTLPKTQLRIKKPTKIEERKCKDKLLEYNSNLKNIANNGMVLSPMVGNSVQRIDGNGDEEMVKETTANHTYSGCTHVSILRKSVSPFEHYYLYAPSEAVWYVEDKTIENIPEEVCCMALDKLNEGKENWTGKAVSGSTAAKSEEWYISTRNHINRYHREDGSIYNEQVSGKYIEATEYNKEH